MTHIAISELCRARATACACFAALPLVRSIASQSVRLPSDSRDALIFAYSYALNLHNLWNGGKHTIEYRFFKNAPVAAGDQVGRTPSS